MLKFGMWYFHHISIATYRLHFQHRTGKATVGIWLLWEPQVYQKHAWDLLVLFYYCNNFILWHHWNWMGLKEGMLRSTQRLNYQSQTSVVQWILYLEKCNNTCLSQCLYSASWQMPAASTEFCSPLYSEYIIVWITDSAYGSVVGRR
jgi:hypothetical protein